MPADDVGDGTVSPDLPDLRRLEGSKLERLVRPDIRSAVAPGKAAWTMPVGIRGKRYIAALRPGRRPLREGAATAAVHKQHGRKRAHAGRPREIGEGSGRAGPKGLGFVVHFPDACGLDAPFGLRDLPQRCHVPGSGSGKAVGRVEP